MVGDSECPIGAIGRPGGRKSAFYLSPIGRPRGEERSDLSPREDPGVVILPHLDEDFFQTPLADEITMRGRVSASDRGQR